MDEQGLSQRSPSQLRLQAITRFETEQLRSQPAAQPIGSLDQTQENAMQDGKIRLLILERSEDVGEQRGLALLNQSPEL